MANVGFGSIADLELEVPRTSAYGGKADIQSKQNCPPRMSALCQERTLNTAENQSKPTGRKGKAIIGLVASIFITILDIGQNNKFLPYYPFMFST